MSRLVADLSLHVTVIYDRREEATDGRGGKRREDGGMIGGGYFHDGGRILLSGSKGRWRAIV